MTTYSADLWDGRETYGSLGVSTASDKAEALQRATEWARKERATAPEDAWCRVIDGVVSSFRLREL
jgi:hypothetical protein